MAGVSFTVCISIRDLIDRGSLAVVSVIIIVPL